MSTTWGYMVKEVHIQCQSTWLFVGPNSNYYPFHQEDLKPVGYKISSFKYHFRCISKFSKLGKVNVHLPLEIIFSLYIQREAPVSCEFPVVWDLQSSRFGRAQLRSAGMQAALTIRKLSKQPSYRGTHALAVIWKDGIATWVCPVQL